MSVPRLPRRPNLLQNPPHTAVEPETVQGGQEIEVSYDGANPVYVSVDFGPWEEVEIDPKTGTGRVVAPPGSSIVAVSDLKGAGVLVEVINPSPSPPPKP